MLFSFPLSETKKEKIDLLHNKKNKQEHLSNKERKKAFAYKHLIAKFFNS